MEKTKYRVRFTRPLWCADMLIDFEGEYNYVEEAAMNFADTTKTELIDIEEIKLAPTAKTQRTPLPMQKIQEMADDGAFLGNVKEIVRAVEQEHGIDF